MGQTEKDVEAGLPLAPAPAGDADPGPPVSKEAAAVPEPPAVGPVPDGGLEAWLQVAGSTAVLACTWGLINTFGVYQSYYEADLLKSNSASEISWVGSAQGALLLLVGVIAGPLFDAGYFRHLLVVGLFLIVFGQFMTSLCTVYWQVLLAQGFCVGIGMGLTFLPSAAILSQYFAKRRALALGISSVGSPVAGIIFPIIFSRLQPQIGFGWATRVIAFILLAVSIPPVIFMRTRVPPSGKTRSIIDMTALRDGPYVVFVLGSLFSFLMLYVPFFYLALFGTSHGIATPDFAPYLVTLLNVGSILGRLVPNALADGWGCMNMQIICTLASAVLAFGWMGIHNLAGAVVFALLYGAFSGGVVSLMPTVIVGLSPDMGRVGARLGTSFLISGVAILVGTPIAGAILGDRTEARWLGTMGYAAAGLLLSALLTLVSRAILYRKHGHWKA
ncbi:major facilitator superfamily domain-containing protein [Lasiosphaeria miniovina]|uniref:Major facilitator superfamily domain-containing protein n=1 Tax=Lasiosphaeria miniovina TaxID=1954250 RepID=A0AA40EB53_9PEZI|nr:major facilitator superfamily domain-containing protein [Lasiosphaeria miniovina]KAK0735064.1 major facilitator superfamily domain-containing protein [Lasiosphaeria miniovina]